MDGLLSPHGVKWREELHEEDLNGPVREIEWRFQRPCGDQLFKGSESTVKAGELFLTLFSVAYWNGVVE